MPNPVINRRTLANASNAFVYDSEVLDWITRVEGLGSSVSQPTKDAANTLMLAIKAAGLRSKIKRFGIYAGDTKAACAAPLIKDLGGTTDSYTAALTSGTWIYSETGAGGGLHSSGSDISNTAVSANDAALGLNDYHIGVYKTTKGNAGITMGAGTTGVGVLAFSFNGGGNQANYFMFSSTGDILGVADTPQTGHYVLARNGTDTAYRNGSSVGTQAAPAGARSTGQIYVHNASLDGVAWGGAATTATIACYHLGTFLTSSEVAALYTPIQAFQTALTRNV